MILEKMLEKESAYLDYSNIIQMPGKPKVMICEDNSMTQKLLDVSLMRMGFDVIVAADGEAGIRLLQENEIDLIITDINMPYNNGLELIQFARSHVERKIPIIIVSNINKEETIQLAEELGSDIYLTKPIDLKQLTEVIKSFNILE